MLRQRQRQQQHQQQQGAINTMVFTHLPSNIMLMLIPLMPSKRSAVAMLMLKCTISQMDVPARQAYVAMVVASEERSAAGGLTNLARSFGLLLAPLGLGVFMAMPTTSSLFDAPFFIAGSLKIGYDLTIYQQFTSGSASK